ncbi:CopG family transcriptional regulator [bacterium]|nr:CopG family transcriptional regulator [bacterium]
MENIIITLDEEVTEWARIGATKGRSCVSRLVGELSKQKMQKERGYQIAMNQFFDKEPILLKRSGKYPSRNEIHER